MGTYAYVGSHMAQSTGENMLRTEAPRFVPFFTFENTLRYCDQVMHHVIKINIPEGDKLNWLRRRDEQVRTDMCAFLNDGLPGDEALQQAMAKHNHLWIMRDHLVAANPPGQARGQVRPRDEGTNTGKGGKGGKGGKNGKQQRLPQPNHTGQIKIQSMYKGQKVCGAFNSVRGCTPNERGCPQRGQHICGYIRPDGATCGDRTHGATFHQRA